MKNDIQKGKVLPIGTERTRGGNIFVKTAEGWKYQRRATTSHAQHEENQKDKAARKEASAKKSKDAGENYKAKKFGNYRVEYSTDNNTYQVIDKHGMLIEDFSDSSSAESLAKRESLLQEGKDVDAAQVGQKVRDKFEKKKEKSTKKKETTAPHEFKDEDAVEEAFMNIKLQMMTDMEVDIDDEEDVAENEDAVMREANRFFEEKYGYEHYEDAIDVVNAIETQRKASEKVEKKETSHSENKKLYADKIGSEGKDKYYGIGDNLPGLIEHLQDAVDGATTKQSAALKKELEIFKKMDKLLNQSDIGKYL